MTIKRSSVGRLTGAAAMLVACLLGVAGLAANRQGRNELAEPPEAIALSVGVLPAVPKSGYTRSLAYVGLVEAKRESDLSFELSGLITSVAVQEGDRVQAGQTLAKLDTSRLDARRRIDAATRDAEQARLDELIAGPRTEQIDAQRGEVARLSAALKRQQLNKQRKEKLLAGRAASVEEYEVARYGSEATGAALSAAQARLRELERGTRPEQIAAQRAVLAQADASLASTDVDIRKSTLQAPFGGVIAERHADEGRVIAVGEPVVRLIEMHRPWVRVGLDVDTAASLQIGQELDLSISDCGTTGMLISIRRDVDESTRTADALLSVQDTDCMLRSGQRAGVMIRREFDTPGLWVPHSSLTEGRRGLWSLFVAAEADNGQARLERRDVELLHSESQRAYVRGAITAGELIVASGTHRLVAGQTVAPRSVRQPVPSRDVERENSISRSGD